jgi:hypothetical protein
MSLPAALELLAKADGDRIEAELRGVDGVDGSSHCGVIQRRPRQALDAVPQGPVHPINSSAFSLWGGKLRDKTDLIGW